MGTNNTNSANLPDESGLELDADIAALLNQALLVSDEPLKQKMADAEDRLKSSEQTKKVSEITRSAIEGSNFTNGDLFDARAMYLWIKDEAQKNKKPLPLDFSSAGEKTLQLFVAFDILNKRLESGKPSEHASADVKESYERGAKAARSTITVGSQTTVRAFFEQMKSVASDVFGKSIEQAELSRLNALADTEEGQRMAEKHGLHVKVKIAPDSLETSKDVFEREALKMLLKGPEIMSEETRKGYACSYEQVETPRNFNISELRKRRDTASYSDDPQKKSLALRLEEALEVHAAYPLLEYEKTVILPALARMYADRIGAYVADKYPGDTAKQRLFFEASKKVVHHPFFANTSRSGGETQEPTGWNSHEGAGRLLADRDIYTFSIAPQNAGLTQEDQDFLNGEWLRARALRGALLSPRTSFNEPRFYKKDDHKPQKDVYGGIAAVDQYLAYKGKRVTTKDEPLTFQAKKGYLRINDGHFSSAVDYTLGEEAARGDRDTLTRKDPTFAHDVMAIQAMEKQILDGLPEEEKKIFYNYDWTPVFKPLFDYTAPDGTIYAYEKRDEQQAHFNQMKRHMASFDKGGENASLRERKRIATIEDAAELTEEYRLRALGIVEELNKAQSQLEGLNKSLATEQSSTKSTAEQAQTSAQRIQQLQRDFEAEKSAHERAKIALDEAKKAHNGADEETYRLSRASIAEKNAR
jgi:hypothetical protein